MIVVEAGDDPMPTQWSVKELRSLASLASTPVLVAVTMAGLRALDLSVGFDDFILLPVVPAEMSVRIRKLLGRTAISGASVIGSGGSPTRPRSSVRNRSWRTGP